jgi:hypothetical protein
MKETRPIDFVTNIKNLIESLKPGKSDLVDPALSWVYTPEGVGYWRDVSGRNHNEYSVERVIEYSWLFVHEPMKKIEVHLIEYGNKEELL